MKFFKSIVCSLTALSMILSQASYAVTPASNKTSLPSTKPAGTAKSVESLQRQAMRIQKALAQGNYAALTPEIHPTKGVRFSMYAYVNPKKDKVFTRSDYRKYLQQRKIKFTWGEKDGSGEPLVTPLPDYLKTWIKADEFYQSSTAVNQFQQGGNSLNNLKQIYPTAEFVEFYRKGHQQYGYLDWRVLRLVFENYQGKRYLVGIVTDEWTI